MPKTFQNATTIAQPIIDWQRQHGRHHLPWQKNHDPYRVWLSEIMLQQTQVETVIPYYERFIQAFPDVNRLAQASLDNVLQHWAGLGYYARARNLHACARIIVSQWSAEFPRRAQDLQTLPGIGRSTAGAIAAFCFGERTPILDGNVRRVFSRFFGIDTDLLASATQKLLWELAEQALPAPTGQPDQAQNMRRYTQGLMDLGATLCTRRAPDCTRCPIRQNCIALATQRVDELPAPRPRKFRTVRQIHVLVLRQDQDLYLIRRPERNIWGGLWSFPQESSEQKLLQPWRALGKAYSCTPQRLTTLNHDLTHLRMVLQPWQLQLPADLARSELPLQTPADSSAWVNPQTWDAYGLPKPIRSILESLRQ